MSWTSLGLFLSFFSLALLGGSANRQPGWSGFRRLYVLQPGPGPAPGPGPGPAPGPGSAEQPLRYNVQLGGFSGPVRTRRMGNQQEQNQQNQLLKLSG